MGAEVKFGRKVRAAVVMPAALVVCGCVPPLVLVKDLETRTNGSIPTEITPASTGMYLALTTGDAGRELFYSPDGVTGDFVKDLAFGSASSWPSGIFTVGKRAFFRADDGTDNNISTTTYSLFVTDGDAASTVRLTSPISQIASDAFVGFGAYGTSGVLFTMNDPTTGIEIWRSDGTVPGTKNVADIYPGTGSSSPAEMTLMGGYYYFAASDGSLDRELWRTDGNTTTRVADINPGTSSSQPRGLAVWNGKLYFGADHAPSFRRGLYVSDGTAGGTTLITDNNDDMFRPETVTATPSRLFFVAYDSQLWVSNGTAGGTSLVHAFSEDSNGDVPTDFVALGSRVVFHMATDAGLDVWSSDGTAGGTVSLATNVDTGSDRFTVFGGKYYYVVGDSIYRTDGTVAGTQLVVNQTGLAPQSLSSALGKLWFAGTDAQNGSEPWSSDGTPTGTALAADVNTSTVSSYPSSYVLAGSYTFFTADTTGYGRELWRTDGTAGGTILVKDINPGTAASTPSEMKAFGGILYFRADDGSTGTELWRSDGTTAGTYRVKDIRSGVTGSFPADIYAGPNYLYFYADDGVAGAELWRSDGTTAGTVLVKDILAGTGASTPRFFGTVGSKVCFVATTTAEGRELWCSDGTAAGTALAKDIRTGTSTSGIDESPVAMGGYLYFGANDGVNGDEVWRTDGTTAGTTRVTNVNAGAGSASPTRFAVMGGGVFFVGYDGTRWEMWRTDGTTTGMITGSINSSPYSNPGLPTPVGSTLFFTATHPTLGYELFKTDGTAGGVQMVKDIYAGATGSSINYMTAVKNQVFFSANDGIGGVELWASDGTAAGTGLVTGGSEDAHSSNPTALAESNGVLYVTVDDADVGQEPFTCSP